ncbi:lytic transglycosylase domain-containing protein [uncultured Ruminococcus sp.]|uniref:lytic transglycosylase domain-containing protein n=1 Tax=uncultured Ruminococcus sp. TaxID=165186 RepID=UPI0025CC575A|nr:lytic transglycosylase domain-containing protein [uncultured Ruminococcus sp.]
MNRNRKMQELKLKYQIAGAIFFFCLLVAILCGGLASSNAKATATTVNEESVITERSSVKVVSYSGTSADKHYYNVPLSDDLQDYIFDVSENYGVPSDVIIAVIQKESNYDQYAVGGSGEQGYMQIHPCNYETLYEELGVTDLFSAEQNILSGAYLLSAFFERYDTINEALMCYNCGEAGANRLWEQGITETDYCRGVTEIMTELDRR